MVERKFTPAEYEKYLKLPTWQLDNEEWDDEDSYHHHWSGTILDWQRSYKEQYDALVDQWKTAIEYVEEHPDTADFDVFAPEIATAKTRVPYAISAIRQKVSMLYCNYPQPQYISPTMQFDQYVSAFQQQGVIELKANDFNSLMFDLGIDVEYSGWGVLKMYVDTDKPGPFGKKGKITIHKLDPAKVAVDPKAKRLRWDCMQFVMVEDDMDLGTARRTFKGAAHRITEDLKGTRQPTKDGMYGHHLMSPVPTIGENNTTHRSQVNVIECWFKDDRLKFVANEVTKENEPTKVTEDGIVANPDYDPDKPQVYDEPEVDDDGYVVGDWIPAYPDGRCIVLCGDKTVVQDFANPFWHKRAPFIFYRGNPSRKLFPVSDLVNIVKIDKKKNDLLSRVHIMAQCEIERPMIADNKAFRPPRMVYKLSGSSTAVLVIQQGSMFQRMPFQEIPQFIWALLKEYDNDMDMVMASAGIQRGQIAEGSQLSAEAVSSLNGMAAGVLKMNAELIAEGNKELGYQMLWLQRETYDEDIVIPVALPDGTTEQVQWHEQEAQSDYIVDIESGTGLPGADAAQSSQGMNLWRESLIDRPKALQMMKFNDWQAICQRMDARERDLISTDAAGRAQGLYLKKILEPDKKDGGAGRKQQA